ncbi:mannosyl-oligosaccharide 1,2-alpha-mannosidase IA-like isoform X1 [Gordionus sp. m RMFG-2023]|uniref:mannosyl-oligosaccharide 1,2-alpha-mannosidase IA-like isoform X1 n=1 Tax=Gordionus sp. m RMFG-2023 TaxID=3053472 RepID=UPI0031FC59DC
MYRNMIYINGIPLSLNKTIRPKKFLIYFILLFLFICLLTFFSLPELTTKKSPILFISNNYSIPEDIYDNPKFVPPFKIPGNMPKFTNSNLYIESLDLKKGIPIYTIAKKESMPQIYIRNKYISEQDSDSSSSDIIHKRNKVKQMMKFAWDGYVKYAFGYNELKPISKQPHFGSIFGKDKLGLTIIDSLDTLLIMNLTNEYKTGYDWVINNLSFNKKSSISIFETNIRYIGGLLTIYLLTFDKKLLDKAMEIADLLMPAFETPMGLPYSTLDINSKRGKNYFWAQGDSFILSEIGTLQLEYELLSKLSGLDIYAQKVMKIREYLSSIPKRDGLVNNYIDPNVDAHRTSINYISLGGLGDSFYEYLIKSYIITDRKDLQGKFMFDQAMKGVQKLLVQKSVSNLTYLAQIRDGKIEHKMDHLACFFGGLLALTSQYEHNQTTSDAYLTLAREITETCHQAYLNSPLHLCPEVFLFDPDRQLEARTDNSKEVHYILRPETFESYFYLYRITGDEIYRDYAWQAVLALEEHTKIGVGYSGVRNVYSTRSDHDDVQQSYFMAEALKYLYLIFCPDTYLPLDKWVFNTEGHPLLKHYLLPGLDDDQNHNEERGEDINDDGAALDLERQESEKVQELQDIEENGDNARRMDPVESNNQV